MKILLVNHQDNRDIQAFSGTSYFMSKAIKESFKDVVEIFLTEPGTLLSDVHEFGIDKALKPIGMALTDFLNNEQLKVDFIICQGGSSSIAHVETSIPIILWHDSTWHTFLHAYKNPESFADFKAVSKHLYDWDEAVLNKASLLIYSSDYVKESCIRNFRIDPKKIEIIPFGANLHEPPNEAAIITGLEIRKASDVINLTFLGRDWKRKGLVSAFQVTEVLNKLGHKAILNVIGCEPNDPKLTSSPYTKIYGELDKRRPDDLERFKTIMNSTHFLLHPALSEPFGIAMCEANAYAVPILGTAVEGLSTVIVNGQNGFALSQESFVKDALRIILEVLADFDHKYVRLFQGTLFEYKHRLNWKTSVLKLKKLLTAEKSRSARLALD